MYTKKIVTLFVFALVVLISVASESKAQTPQTVKVDPTKFKTDTGVKMDAGDIVEVIDVKGTVWLSGPGGGGGGVTYRGNEKAPLSPTYYEYPAAVPSSLVGFIGDKKNFFQIRMDIFTEAKTNGNLFFAFNDGTAHYFDNKGGFEVTYRIIKKAKICSPQSGNRLPIKWVNKTGKPIMVHWIGFDCKEGPGKLVQPNGIYGGETSVGHIFRLRDEKGADLGLISVESYSTNVDITIK